MKISNEAKIGIIAIAALIVLFLGFSFLKGKNIFHKETKMYAVYNDVLGLKQSNPVVINGLQVGKISNIDGGKDMKQLLVTVTFGKDVNIPINSIAIINPNLLGSPTLEIQLGNSTTYKSNGDTLLTTASSGAFDEALKVLNPVLYEVRNAVKSLDSVLQIVGTTFDPQTKNNIKDIIANLSLVTLSFTTTAKSLEVMMDPEKGALAQSLRNVNQFTANLNGNNAKLDSIMQNVNIATRNIAAVNVQQTMDSLDVAVNNLKNVSEKFNNKDGSLGLLLNDKSLYNNLEATSNKLNILVDDIRVHPKRYVNISVFGKKDKGNYLTAPMVDDTVMVLDPKTMDTFKVVTQ